MTAVIPGQRFGYWTVRGWHIPGSPWLLCRCDCENAVDEVVHEDDLIDGYSTQCGDCARACRQGNLRGKQVGWWTVVARADRTDSARHSYWLAVCSCGHIGRVRDQYLRRSAVCCYGCTGRLKNERRGHVNST